MIQNIIVWAIGIVVFVLLAVKFYRLMKIKKNDSCTGCSGCDKGKKCDK